MPTSPRCSWLVVLVACGCASPAPSDTTLRWDEEPGRSLALLRDGQEIWRFHYGDDRTKPCFHPLALPGNRTLTVDQPADHRWHHGLWFSWKLIDGVNYWEHDNKTGRPVGRTTWTVTGIDRYADGAAGLQLELTYAPAGGTPVLAEQRLIAVSAPQADGSFTIDWDGAFTALADCVLDRTPVPGEPGGRAHGGYAGLSLRLVDFEQREAVTTDGAVVWNDAERFRGRATAMEYDGLLAGEPVGVAILDHHENLNAPSPWYAIRSRAMTFFTPAVLCLGPQRLRAGDRLRLRYRVCVHPGRWYQQQLAAAATGYSAGTATHEDQTP